MVLAHFRQTAGAHGFNIEKLTEREVCTVKYQTDGPRSFCTVKLISIPVKYQTDGPRSFCTVKLISVQWNIRPRSFLTSEMSAFSFVILF